MSKTGRSQGQRLRSLPEVCRIAASRSGPRQAVATATATTATATARSPPGGRRRLLSHRVPVPGSWHLAASDAAMTRPDISSRSLPISSAPFEFRSDRNQMPIAFVRFEFAMGVAKALGAAMKQRHQRPEASKWCYLHTAAHPLLCHACWQTYAPGQKSMGGHFKRSGPLQSDLRRLWSSQTISLQRSSGHFLLFAACGQERCGWHYGAWTRKSSGVLRATHEYTHL